MKIEETYDSLEAIPEELRENYVEGDDGKFQLAFIGGLKSALHKERENVSTLTREVKRTEESIADKLTAREEELKQEFSQRESAIRKEVAESFHSDRKKSIAAVALQKAGGNIALLEDKVVSQLAIGEDGSVSVVDSSGAPLIDETGNALTVDGLVASFRTDPLFSGAFKGTGNSGGGGAGAEGGKPVNGASLSLENLRRSKMTPRQKVDFINEHGNDKFMSLPQ